MSFHYLLDAKAEGRIVKLRFYCTQTNKIREVTDADYKPYFYLSSPLSNEDEKGIKDLYGESQSVKKRNLFKIGRAHV
jgi:hypothetical protein